MKINEINEINKNLLGFTALCFFGNPFMGINYKSVFLGKPKVGKNEYI